MDQFNKIANENGFTLKRMALTKPYTEMYVEDYINHIKTTCKRHKTIMFYSDDIETIEYLTNLNNAEGCVLFFRYDRIVTSLIRASFDKNDNKPFKSWLVKKNVDKVCPICFHDVDVKDDYVGCYQCNCFMHIECEIKLIKAFGIKYECPKCRYKS